MTGVQTCALPILDGTNGFKLKGFGWRDKLGYSVSTAGDVNGDGYADILIGAPEFVDLADSNETDGPGKAYVVFGKSGNFGASVDLESLDGTDGFVREGIDEWGESGYSVSTAGDENGDGYGDMLIGTYGADSGGDSFAGETYFVYGRDFTGDSTLSGASTDDPLLDR